MTTKAEVPAKQKEKTVHLVVQQGGASTEMYLHTFGSLREANTYRRSAARASYKTTEPVEIPAALETHIGTIEDIVTAAVELVS